MTTLSKNTMPSLVNIACTAMIKTCSMLIIFPVSNQNAVLYKNAKYPSPTLKKTISQVSKRNALIMPSNQKEVKTLVPFEPENGNQLQRFEALNGFEMLDSISLARIGTMLILFILNGLQKPYAENGKTMEIFGMVSLTTEDPFLKCIGSVLEKPMISNPLFKQLPFETDGIPEDSKDSQNSAEMAIDFSEDSKNDKKSLHSDNVAEMAIDFPEDSKNEKKSLDSDNVAEFASMKASKTCFSCKESIEKKKFFGERRFGILGNCNCMLCYGCIRKTSGTSDGVVKGPVCCPSCNVKSDTVASTRRWIENQEKIEFFETFNKNLRSISKKSIAKWTSFLSKEDSLWIKAPKSDYSETFRKNLQGPVGKANMIWKKLAQDGIWTRESTTLLVN